MPRHLRHRGKHAFVGDASAAQLALNHPPRLVLAIRRFGAGHNAAGGETSGVQPQCQSSDASQSHPSWHSLWL
jgi:hypothetical protein